MGKHYIPIMKVSVPFINATLWLRLGGSLQLEIKHRWHIISLLEMPFLRFKGSFVSKTFETIIYVIPIPLAALSIKKKNLVCVGTLNWFANWMNIYTSSPNWQVLSLLNYSIPSINKVVAASVSSLALG